MSLAEPSQPLGGARGCRGGGAGRYEEQGDRVLDVNCGVRVHRSVVPPLASEWERKKDSRQRRVKKVVSPRGARTSLFRKFLP